MTIKKRNANWHKKHSKKRKKRKGVRLAHMEDRQTEAVKKGREISKMIQESKSKEDRKMARIDKLYRFWIFRTLGVLFKIIIKPIKFIKFHAKRIKKN